MVWPPIPGRPKRFALCVGVMTFLLTLSPKPNSLPPMKPKTRRTKPMTFTVIVPETHYTYYKVKARSEAQAKELVAAGRQESVLTEFSHADMDTNNWAVNTD